MENMDIKKFKEIVEAKKQTFVEEPVVEYTHIGEVLLDITKELEKTGRVRWDWNFSKNIKDTGYLNGEPFVIFPSMSTIKNGLLAFRNRFIEFHGNNQYCYKELIKDEYGIDIDINKNNTYTSLIMVYKNEDDKFSYQENIKTEYYGKSPRFNFFVKEINDLYDKLKNMDIAKKVESTTGGVRVSTEYSFNDDFVVCYATYPNLDYYKQGFNPYLVEILKRKDAVETLEHFILLEDGRYINASRCLTEDMSLSVVSYEEIQNMIKAEDLSLRLSDRLEEILLSDGLGPKEVTQILSGGRKFN